MTPMTTSGTMIRVAFDIHQRVKIDGDVPGIVTMIRIHPGFQVDYFVAWWSAGQMSEQWIDEARLSL